MSNFGLFANVVDVIRVQIPKASSLLFSIQTLHDHPRSNLSASKLRFAGFVFLADLRERS